MDAGRSGTIGAAVVLQPGRGVPSWIAQRLRAFGPYVIIELLLPGGTLISLLLYLYRRRGSAPVPELSAMAAWMRKCSFPTMRRSS